jgi:SpoVK/Ycf46/Vps4 family AAA+-type ATPase
VVSQFAESLGWPLISLNPGYFIVKGLEMFEAVAGCIFADLMKLDHAVVFFDECDELFRDRATKEEGARNILSFATASMLPKLQRLHDARKVIFVLGTNFVRNIDPAIRRLGRFDAILLFDRPDRTARATIARQHIARARTTTPDLLNDADAKEVERIADSSGGWMIEQVISRASSYAYGKLHTTPKIADYEEWCTREGKNEIEAAGLEPTERSQLLERWKPFIKT